MMKARNALIRPCASASSSPAAAPTSSPSPATSAKAASPMSKSRSSYPTSPTPPASRPLATSTLPAAVYVSKGRPRADHDGDLIGCLREHNVDLVCLAGYMRLLSPGFIAAFPNRILNIHPSLLPAFPGLDAQQQAFDYGVKIAGCTVHFVDEHLDHGAIILQRAIPVLETDDAHSLAERILVEEHIAYTEAINRVASGEYEIRGRHYAKR